MLIDVLTLHNYFLCVIEFDTCIFGGFKLYRYKCCKMLEKRLHTKSKETESRLCI